MLNRFFPLLLFFLAGTVAADSATMWVFPDGRGAIPIETDQITMEAESVSIVPTGNMLTYSVPEMKVTWHFTDWKPVEDISITSSGHYNVDDRLTLEILEIYPGSTYQDAAVSELSLNII